MKKLLLLFTFGVAALPLLAALQLPPLIGDRMVLQRDCKAPIWGTAEAGSVVTVTFADQKHQVKVDANGRWQILLHPLKASTQGRELVILCEGQTQTVGEDKIVVKDVLVGDVFLMIGEGRAYHIAAWDRGSHPYVALAKKQPLVRYFFTQEATAEEPAEQIGKQWLAPKDLGGMSRIPYFIGWRLQERLGPEVPVGVLSCTHLKAKMNAWTSPKGYVGVEALAKEYEQVSSRLPGGKRYQVAFEKYLEQLEAWKREALARSEQGLPCKHPPKMDQSLAFARDAKGNIPITEPTAAYNAMIHPLLHTALRAIIYIPGSKEHADTPQAKAYHQAYQQGWKPHSGAPDCPVIIAPFVANGKILDEQGVRTGDAVANLLKLPSTTKPLWPLAGMEATSATKGGAK